MLTIHRWFDITPAKTDLKYEPLYTFDDAWKKTMEWMANNRTYEKGAANPTKVRNWFFDAPKLRASIVLI